MISLEDCIGVCELTRDEIAAIALHEHIGEISAAALGDYLLHAERGPSRIRDMIRDDIRAAIAAGDAAQARALVTALAHFLAQHPEATVR
jgi:hypothetical protein